ncbi:hypothetical protein AHAS_Ahas13G0386300 [Arachis hypogaea]
MAPKVGESSSRKRKEKASSTISHEINRFYTKVHEEHYHKIVSKKKVISEVKFDLKLDEYPEIQERILSMGWKVLTNPVIEVGVLKVREFYTNLWVTDKHSKDTHPEFKTWRTMVQGKTL